MLSVLHTSNLDRRSYVVVIGSGAILDAVRFAVAITYRGLRLVRLPTTTLAQSDSGVGVENAVNLFQKKNWIGTLAVPWVVINDATLLESLKQRDFISGFSEAVKVSLLKDRTFFEQICNQTTRLRQRTMDVAQDVIRKLAEWHLKHITQGGNPWKCVRPGHSILGTCQLTNWSHSANIPCAMGGPWLSESRSILFILLSLRAC